MIINFHLLIIKLLLENNNLDPDHKHYKFTNIIQTLFLFHCFILQPSDINIYQHVCTDLYKPHISRGILQRWKTVFSDSFHEFREKASYSYKRTQEISQMLSSD